MKIPIYSSTDHILKDRKRRPEGGWMGAEKFFQKLNPLSQTQSPKRDTWSNRKDATKLMESCSSKLLESYNSKLLESCSSNFLARVATEGFWKCCLRFLNVCRRFPETLLWKFPQSLPKVFGNFVVNVSTKFATESFLWRLLLKVFQKGCREGFQKVF